MAQITNITSEALQATIRRLLPSQQGFGEDLQASNVITPIIDLTPTAEGSILPSNLQQALGLGGTSTTTSSASDVIANVGGFYRVVISFVSKQTTGSDISGRLEVTDGATTTILLQYTLDVSGSDYAVSNSNDLIVFLASGQSLQQVSDNGNMIITSYNRQIATITGNLVNPTGFTSE